MQPVKLIAICFSTLHEEDRFNFVAELNKHAVKYGYRLLVFNSCADLYEQSPESNEGASAVFRLIPYDILSALIIFPNIIYDPNMVEEIRVNCVKRNLPIISMDKDMEGCITFTFNNSNVFEKLCRHVIERHNARNIFLMAGFMDNVYSQERVKAFRRALEINKLPYIPENVGYGCFWEQPTIEVLNQWFIKEERKIPDAIICANDLMAITVSEYLQNMGVEIPKDCIVTGFDGIKQVEYLPPRITTCKQDFEKMSTLIIDTLEKLLNNIPVEKSYCVDFSIDFAESCGCKKINYKNVSTSIRSLLTSLRKSDERQKMICYTQTSMPNLSDINFLPRFLVRRFKFHTCVFMLNDSVFNPPHFGSLYKGENCYSKEVEVMYHCYRNQEYERCRIPTSRLFPRYDLLFENENPIVICCSHYIDMVMGYCVFQPEIDIDEYEKMHMMMTAITSTLGNFHSRVQIRSMNEELQRLSQRDYMTGLFNRRGFYEKMYESFRENNHIGSTLMIISVDMDRLKYINDTFGHSEGDSAIITIANALVSSSLHSKLCARFGGDEFCTAIFTYSNDPEQVFEEFKVRFLEALVEYNRNSRKSYNVRASIGCSYEIVTADINIDALINKADEQMYVYKLAHKRKK